MFEVSRFQYIARCLITVENKVSLFIDVLSRECVMIGPSLGEACDWSCSRGCICTVYSVLSVPAYWSDLQSVDSHLNLD